MLPEGEIAMDIFVHNLDLDYFSVVGGFLRFRNKDVVLC